jgi:predicted transcriptional regulator
MKRTQIQLPDELYRRLKRLADQLETSFSDVVRQASQQYVQMHPEVDRSQARWSPPEPKDMGRILAPESEWRLLANEGFGFERVWDPL